MQHVFTALHQHLSCPQSPLFEVTLNTQSLRTHQLTCTVADADALAAEGHGVVRASPVAVRQVDIRGAAATCTCHATHAVTARQTRSHLVTHCWLQLTCKNEGASWGQLALSLTQHAHQESCRSHGSRAGPPYGGDHNDLAERGCLLECRTC